MGLEEKKPRDLVGFLPDEAGGHVDSFNKVDDPLVEGTVLDGEESEAGAKEDREDDEGPFNDNNEIAGEEEIGETKTNTQLKELLERHVAHESELVLSDVLRDRVLLHTFKYTS